MSDLTLIYCVAFIVCMHHLQLRSHKEATKHDVSDPIPGEICQEQVNLVIPAGVHQEHGGDKVQVSCRVRGYATTDSSDRLTIFSKIIKSSCFDNNSI